MRIHVQNQEGDSIPHAGPEQWKAAVVRAGIVGAPLEASFGLTRDDLQEGLVEAEILVTTSGVLRAMLPLPAPRLKLISLMHAGVEGLAGIEALPVDVKVLNNSGVHREKAGEYVAMAVLMLANHMPFFYGLQQRNQWKKRFGRSLAGRRATIVGLGSLGSGAACRLRMFGMKITGITATNRPREYCDSHLTVDRLALALPESEFLILACPLTPRTHGLLGSQQIAALPKGAGIVNIGRGELIDQDALIDALSNGHLSGAVLDVFAPEPVPPDHRLWSTPNLIMTPHVSAADPTTYIPRTLDIFFANLQAFLDGRVLPNLVDLTRGY